MKTFTTLDGWHEYRRSLTPPTTVGFVPTMGALHEGHIALIERSRAENDRTSVSIFVNPTQFDNPEDLLRYPRTLAQDLEKLQIAGVDAVFVPEARTLYPDDYKYRVEEAEISPMLCGRHRPGHFAGVLTVVMKLLNLVRPTRAYFGEKDYQQLRLIQGMVEAFFLDVQIVPCATVRETDGLAKSSRNQRLSTEGRSRAAVIFKALREAPSPARAREELEKAGLEVDYVEELFGRRFIAARLENVRLIDNVSIDNGG